MGAYILPYWITHAKTRFVYHLTSRVFVLTAQKILYIFVLGQEANTQTVGSRGKGPRPYPAPFSEVNNMDNIVQIVTQLGFPIAMCLLLFWYVTKKDEAHREEMNKMSEAVNNNTIVMQKLIDKLGGN